MAYGRDLGRHLLGRLSGIFVHSYYCPCHSPNGKVKENSPGQAYAPNGAMALK